MAKRSATSELNHDNWNAPLEEEEAGNFTPLAASELSNRVIRKAKRSLNTDSPGNKSQTSSSPFAKFSGFSSSTAAASPFSSFTKNASSNFGSPFKIVPKTEAEKPNGNVTQTEEKAPGSGDLKKSNSSSSTSSTSTAAAAAADKQPRNIEYYRQLQSLNESVLKWMQLHLAKNSCCDFTPVFNDYKKHMDSLNVTYPVKKKDSPTTVAENKDADIFKRPLVSKDAPVKDTNNHSDSNAHSFFKKTNNVKKDETDYGAHFSSNTTNTSTFSFGCKRTPTATSSISPAGPASSSKEEEIKPEAEEEKKDTPFSFGYFSRPNQSSSDKPFSFLSAPAGKSEDNTSDYIEEYVPPKNEFVAVSEDDAIYSKRCKLFFKKGDNYAEKGVGTLFLKSLEGKTQLLIRADTSLGNILLNIMLSASLPMSRTGKNNVLLVCIPNPPVDAKNPDSKEAIPILIRVKTAEDADELLETLNNHKS